MTKRLNDFLTSFANDLGHETFEQCPFTHEVTGAKETLYSEAELAGEDTMDLCDPFWDDEEF